MSLIHVIEGYHSMLTNKNKVLLFMVSLHGFSKVFPFIMVNREKSFSVRLNHVALLQTQ